MSLYDYAALRDKVDAFAAGVHERRAADLSCRRGCAGCCHVELTVCEVEAAAIRAQLDALDGKTREALRARAASPNGNGNGNGNGDDEGDDEGDEDGDGDAPRCVMLGDDDACAIYAARPLVCRSQGLPLRYPAELIPAESLRARSGSGAVTWCPLNFREAASRPPAAADVLDAERVDQALALINRRYAERTGTDPLARTALRALARQL
jgi:Fe-S-cluster containining protein